MKILFVTLEDISQHKGSTTHIREKVAAFRNRGHTVTVVGGCSKESDLADFKSIGSFRNEFGSISYLALAIVFLRLAFHIVRNAKKVDLIYVREPVAAFATVFTKPIHRLKIIFEVNSLDNEEIRMKGDALGIRIAYCALSFLQRVVARFADEIIVITDLVKDYYQKNYKVAGDRITVLGVTTDLEKFHPMDDASARTNLRDRLGIPQDAFVAAFIGNLAHWQDFGLLLEGARIVLERNPNIYFVITGDGSQKGMLERGVVQKRLQDRVLLTGSVPHSEVARHINMCDICIAVCKELASGYSPMKLFEYFACGKPVVATRVRGYEIVEQIRAGRLIDGSDAEAFAFAVLRFAENKEWRKECGESALRFARENFGWEKVVSAIEPIMRDVVSVPGTAG